MSGFTGQELNAAVTRTLRRQGRTRAKAASEGVYEVMISRDVLSKKNTRTYDTRIERLCSLLGVSEDDLLAEIEKSGGGDQ